SRIHLVDRACGSRCHTGRYRHFYPTSQWQVRHSKGVAALFRATDDRRYAPRECETVSTYCERSEAIHCHLVHGKTDCFAALAMTWVGRSPKPRMSDMRENRPRISLRSSGLRGCN